MSDRPDNPWLAELLAIRDSPADPLDSPDPGPFSAKAGEGVRVARLAVCVVLGTASLIALLCL